MKFKSNLIQASEIALALIGFLGIEARAQTPLLSYAAKFVCGGSLTDEAVVKGFYQTTVNIHNPHFSRVDARKKAVIALPQSDPPGAISAFVLERLPPDAAVGVNCKDIRALFVPSPTGFIEGFVVVRVPPGTPLDVTDVITARPGAAGAAGEVSTINVYEVHPTRIVAP